MEAVKLTGHVKIWRDAELICDAHNRVVDVGLQLFARRFMGEEGALLPTKFVFGDSAALTTQDMTELQGSQIAECATETKRRNNVLSWSGNFTYSEPTERTCREVALVNAEATPVMMARFLPVQQFILKSGTEIRINWEIVVGE